MWNVTCFLNLKKRMKEGSKKNKRKTPWVKPSVYVLNLHYHHLMVFSFSKWFSPSDDNVLLTIQITDEISYFIKWEDFPFWTISYPQKGNHLNSRQALVLEIVTGTISAMINKSWQTHSCNMLSSTKSVRISETGRILSYLQDGTPVQDSCLENPMDRGAW